uniref:cell division cycle and apoptosis regulator protein 1 isoform X6 n=1 Tax=Agelaius phoeniceus TaxID=39638 RepID=UPI0023EA80D6|nr:cell division cycle and apoptosis regulator protein 1 isoform X6 [Agelaius phoeniceus]
MAQFGGQKNPPWATQFTATAVSQPAALGVQQPSLLGASPTIYTQQTALAAAGLTTQSPANYQLSQSAALQQQAAAAAAALQQVKHPPRPALPELRPAKGPRRKGEWQMQYSQPQQTLYSVQQQLQQPQQTLLTQPAVALPTSLSLSTPQPAAQITVSYPAPRSSQQQTQPQKQRVFTGVVTKLHDTFGFVDEDVFFQLSAVKGKTPQVGDRVLVEATYNPNMPFKWNAQRIQTLPNQNQSQAQPLLKTPPAVLQPLAQQTFGVQAQPQPQSLLQAQISAASITPLLQTQPQPLLQQPQQKGGLLQPPVRLVSQPQPARRLDPPSRFSGRNDRGGDPMPNRKDDRSRERERERRRSRERSPQRKRSRERSPRRDRERSPRRPRRVLPRYTVQFSKFSLDCRSCDMMELRRRYQNLYIPSDFFDAQFTWVDAFPMSRPFQLGNYCNFYVMHREVDPIDKNAAVLDPPDADHLYSAKVMLMASPSMEDLYHKSCALAEDPQELRDGFQHPARLVKDEEEKDDGEAKEISTPTHWSKLDPKTMKVNDLRKELESRTLSSKGLKSQLIARLTKQLKVEEQKEEQKELEKSEKEEEEEEDRKSEDDKEEEERKRQEELERQRRERRYILPDEPAIIVHPNWAAKSGKFDCSIMSLSVLLDYRLEDNKEHSFEVSLFAELFNEMLQRDFGVRIYKALISLPEREDKKDKKSKKDERKEKKEEKDDETDDPKPKRRKSGDDKDKKEERDEKKREDKRKDDSKEEEEPEEDNNQEEYDPMEAEEAEDEDEDRDEEEMNKREDRKEGNKHCKERASKDKEKDKTQMVTVNRDLLMAFVYFDQSHCGYLLEKDMEEILYTLGLHLSRAQVKKLLNKVVLRESCFYRRLTDTSKDEENQEESEELQEDMLGNRLLLPSPTVKQECKAVEENVGLIVYNGAMVDVGSLLQKLEKSERVRAEIEQKLQLLEEKTDEDEKTILQLENSNKSLSAELKEVKKDLGQLQENLKTSDDKKLQFEGQLNKTIKNLATVMDEIQSVLKQEVVKNEDKDQKSKENGANV